MNNSEAMDLLIPRFFLNEHVMDGKLSVNREALLNAYVDNVTDDVKDVLWSSSG